MKVKSFFLWLLLLIFSIVIVGCVKDQQTNSQGQEKQGEGSKETKRVESSLDALKNIPISIDEGEFEKVFGWLDEQHIIYVTSIGTGSNVYAYNLSDGSNTFISKSNSDILSIDISHTGKYLLVRSAPSEFQSRITIMKPDGSVVFSETIEAFDLNIEWNPYNEDKVLISTFTEDWQDQSFILSIANEKMTEIQLINPFSNWLTEKELIYLDWIQDDTSLFSDLFKKDLESGQDEKLLKNIYQFDAFTDVFMTVTIDENKKDEALYEFYGKDMKKLGSFVTPHLLRFSDWLVPYYDYNPDQKFLMSLQPLHTGMVDTYKDGFQLFKYDMKQKEKFVIMSDLENEPLRCSRDGNFCLYGYNFEKLIDLNKKKIINLVMKRNDE